MTNKLKIGQIWIANLNPNKGSEPGKTRPVLILQDQALLDIEHPSTLIIPLTTKLTDNGFPLRIRVPAQHKLKEDSDLLVDQIRAIDNTRLIKGPLATLTSDLIQRIHNSICLIVGFNWDDSKAALLDDLENCWD